MTRAQVVVVAVLGALGAVAAWLLADTVVPGNLVQPRVHVDAVFGPTLVDEAERYERFLLADWVLSQVVLFGTLAVYARYGARYARESAAGPIGTGMLLGMLGLAIVWLTQLPFALAALWWERRHEVSEVGYLEAVFGGWLGLGGTFVAVCIALLVVMALARRLGSWWWIPGAAVFTLIVAVLVFVGPYLVPGLKKPDDPQLVRTYDRFEQAQGVDDIPLRIEEVSGDTSQANAYAFGMGPSATIVLWDTLLDGRFSDEEVNVVLAHELGHHSSGHLIEGIEWYALFALPGAWLIAVATRRRGGMANPAAVPLSLLVIVVLDLLSLPVYNLVSRHMEAEADWKALETTHDPTSAEALFKQFTIQSLNDPDPPTWSYVLFDSHPSVEERIAMAEAWKARSR